jgi:hypothetical protein
VEDRELAESVESVRIKRAGGRGDGGEEEVKQAPALSILATRSVSMSVRGLTGVWVWTLPEDAAGGGGVGLLTSEVIFDGSVNEIAKPYVHLNIHTLVSLFVVTKPQRHGF